MTTQSTPNFYDILGVSRKATTGQIREAYRKLARERHPDSFSDARKAAKEAGNEKLLRILEEKIQEAEEEFKRINEAYETLSDPAKRRRYDEELDRRAQHHPPSSDYMPPKIRLSKTSVDLGQLPQGKDHSDSFIIYNDGGPVSEIAIGWVDNPLWAEVKILEDPRNTFPIKVTVLVHSARASLGRNEAALGILINGIPWGVVPVIVTVVSPAPTSQTKPRHAQKTTPPPTPIRAAPKSATKATGRSSDGCELLIILVGILVVILLAVVFFGSSGGTSSSENASQSNQPSVSGEQAEVQRVISNPISIITGIRIGSVDCHQVPLNSQWLNPDNCEYTWGKYTLSNNMRYLAASLKNETCMTIDPGIWWPGIEFGGASPLLEAGNSITVNCQESHRGQLIATCGYVNAYSWDGSSSHKILTNDQRVCWSR